MIKEPGKAIYLGYGLIISMTKTKWVLLLALMIFVLSILGCTSTGEPSPTITPIPPTVTLPDPKTETIKAPPVSNVFDQYFSALKDENYAEMYSMLTTQSKEQVTEEDFTRIYRDFVGEFALDNLSYEITASKTNPESAFVSYDLTYSSDIFGDISHSYDITLVLEDGEWRIPWDESLIIPELVDGNYLKRNLVRGARGTIYDINQAPLATQADAIAVGLRPDFVNLEESEGLVSLLARISDWTIDDIIFLIDNSVPGAYIPIAEVGIDEYGSIIRALSGYDAVVISEYNSRFYPDGGIAPHVVGYISAIQQDEVDKYKKLGYQSYEKVGREGIEEWGEPYLAGKPGGSLYLLDKDGNVLQEMGQVEGEPAQNIYTTIDSEFQQGVEDAISTVNGAVVVLERDTGKVLAMASSPDFNPNGFQTENINWDSWLNEIYGDTYNPLLNRASQGQYPLGSVFKIITTAAALESGLYTADTTYDCGYFFNEAPGLNLHDWTYEWYLEDGETPPSGVLTLPQGLIRSCNPYFWHIGYDLYQQGMETALSDMARGFGLGSPTGIEGIKEEAGNVSDPKEPVDAINMAIGQGDLLVTPLQVANFTAAVGNGGDLFIPWVIDRIEDQDGNIVLQNSPVVQSTLPVSPENLKVIQDAMVGVVSSRTPRGTAEKVFRGFKIPVAGKTGTAESEAQNPHAWFTGFTLAGREDKPDIAVAVIVENAGEGSEWAAPIFRRIIELYFYGAPKGLYPWEAAYGIKKTPTPEVFETPTPENGG